jgi:hypothetical protein
MSQIRSPKKLIEVALPLDDIFTRSLTLKVTPTLVTWALRSVALADVVN